MMKRIVTLNIATILTLSVFFLITYYFLLMDSFFSISSIIASAHHLAIKKHLLVLGLLPIYIATVIFGTATLGIYLGTSIQDRILRLKEKSLQKSPLKI